MKNYFSSVVIPRSDPTPEKVANALAQLVDQLRITVNNIDLDNMSPSARSSLSYVKIHLLTADQLEAATLNKVKKGDLVVVAGEEMGRLAKIEDIYICKYEQ